MLQRATSRPTSLTATDVTRLQRSAGNQAVQRLLSGSSQRSGPGHHTHAHHTHIQRAPLPITRTPGGTPALQRDDDGGKAKKPKPVAKMMKNSLLDPGVPAKVKEGSPVYTPGHAQEDGSAATLTQAGALTKAERGLSHQTGDPEWVKFTFQTQTMKRQQLGRLKLWNVGQGDWSDAPAKLDSGQALAEGFVARNRVSFKDLGGNKVNGFRDVSAMPLFHTDKAGKVSVSPSDVYQGYIGNCMFMAAMVKLADMNPSNVVNMFTDHGASVTVKLFLHGTPKTVTVRKTVLEGKIMGRKYVIGAQNKTVLWPAILEKAMAKLLGGYREISPGKVDPYEILTGREVPREQLFDRFDLNRGVKPTQNLDAVKFKDDFQKWNDFVQGAVAGKQGLWDHLDSAGIWDLDQNAFRGVLKQAGCSDAFIAAVVKEYGHHFEKGGVETGEYTAETIAGWNRIKAIIDRGEIVETGTRTLKGGSRFSRGHSGGENTTAVPGLAAPHAYAVLGYKTVNKNGKDVHYLTVRNPWGHTGLKYKNGKRQKQKDATFDIELSDARLYFGEKSGWRYTSTNTDDLIVQATSYKLQNGSLTPALSNNLAHKREGLERSLQTERNNLQHDQAKALKYKSEYDEAQKQVDTAQESYDKLGEELDKIDQEKNPSQYKSKQNQQDKVDARLYKLKAVAEKAKAALTNTSQNVASSLRVIDKLEKKIARISDLIGDRPTVAKKSDRRKSISDKPTSAPTAPTGPKPPKGPTAPKGPSVTKERRKSFS